MFASRSAKTIVLSSGQALTALVGVVSMAVLTRVFSIVDYATYRQTILAYAFAAPFTMMGVDRALFYFLPSEKRRPRGLLVENLLLLTLGGSILTLFVLLGGNHLLARRFNNPALAPTLMLLAPYPLLMFPATAVTACLMARDGTPRVAVFNVVSRLLMLVCVLLPTLLWTSPATAVLGTVAGAALALVMALALMFQACTGGPWQPTLSGMWRQLAFGVPLGLAGMMGALAVSLDQVLVSALCSPETYAVYSVGAMEIPLVNVITGSITSVLMIDYCRFHQDNRPHEIVALIHRAMAKSGMLLLPTMVLLWCVAPPLMRVLFGVKYEGSAVPFRVYLLLLPIRTITFGAILQATGHSRKLLNQSALGLAATTLFAWVGILTIGSTGAAIGSVLATYLISVPVLAWSIRGILKTPIARLFPWGHLTKLLVASSLPAPAIFAMLTLCRLPDVVSLVAASLAYAGLFWAALYVMRLTTFAQMCDVVRKLVSLA